MSGRAGWEGAEPGKGLPAEMPACGWQEVPRSPCAPRSPEGGSELEKKGSGVPSAAEPSDRRMEEVAFWLAPHLHK